MESEELENEDDKKVLLEILAAPDNGAALKILQSYGFERYCDGSRDERYDAEVNG